MRTWPVSGSSAVSRAKYSPTPPLSQSGARPNTRSASASVKEETQTALRRSSRTKESGGSFWSGSSLSPKFRTRCASMKASVGA